MVGVRVRVRVRVPRAERAVQQPQERKLFARLEQLQVQLPLTLWS